MENDNGGHIHIQDDKHLYVTDNGVAICSKVSSLGGDNKGNESDMFDRRQVHMDLEVFNVGERIILTVYDWISYPDGRIRLNLLYGADNSVSANRYMGFAIRGNKDNGSRRYYYFKTARISSTKRSTTVKEQWSQSSPFQEKFKLIFDKITAEETRVYILDKDDNIFYEKIFTDSFPETIGNIKYISVFMTGSTRAKFTLQKV